MSYKALEKFSLVLYGTTGGTYSAPFSVLSCEPRAGSSRFSEKGKNYLTARFDLGEQTERKADPQQVSKDMLKTTDEQNNRLFDRKEWLTKSQV